MDRNGQFGASAHFATWGEVHMIPQAEPQKHTDDVSVLHHRSFDAITRKLRRIAEAVGDSNCCGCPHDTAVAHESSVQSRCPSRISFRFPNRLHPHARTRWSARRQHGVPLAVNAFWANQSFHHYADYAMSDAFACGLAELRELGHARRCAVMCAEAVWWRCHRRIIADYLIAAGETVFHILGPGHVEAADAPPEQSRDLPGTLIYPAAYLKGCEA